MPQHKTPGEARASTPRPTPGTPPCTWPKPCLLLGKQVREDAVHVFPKGRAGAAHVHAPRLQRATWEPLGAGLGVHQEAWLRLVQWAASGRGPRRGTATSALQGPWKQTRHVRRAGRAPGWLGAEDGPSGPDSEALCSSVKWGHEVP